MDEEAIINKIEDMQNLIETAKPKKVKELKGMMDIIEKQSPYLKKMEEIKTCKELMENFENSSSLRESLNNVLQEVKLKVASSGSLT